MNTEENLKIESSNHIKSKLIKLYLHDMNNPLIIISYKYNNNHIERPFIREKIWSWVNSDGSKRNISYLPCIFVRRDLIDNCDLTTLNIANQIYLSTNSTILHTVDNEVDLIRFIKKIQRGKKYRKYEEEIISNEDSKVKLKNPHKDFVIYDTKVFNEVSTRIQIEITKKYQNKNKDEE